jgi:hypothetical protein
VHHCDAQLRYRCRALRACGARSPEYPGGFAAT